MVLVELIDSSIDLVGEFVSVASQGPVEGFLVLISTLILAVSVGTFGILVLGAVVDLLTPGSEGATHPQD
jgi:hypothetical protein